MQIEYVNTPEEAAPIVRDWESLGYTVEVVFDGAGFKVIGK